MVCSESASANQQLKYARPERERRLLLGSQPIGEVVRRVRIADRYLHGTRRLRLCRATKTFSTGGTSDQTVYRLAQKVLAPGGEPGLITTIYRDAAD